MIQPFIIILSIFLLIAIFFRRLYLLEKGQMFGKMVFKRGSHLHSKLTKEDHEITIKEMIPTSDTVDPKNAIKAERLYKKVELEIKRNHLQEAEKLLIQVIALNPAYIEAYAQLGKIYLVQNQFGKAELIYRKLIVSIQDDPSYFSNLGLALYQQKKLEEAKTFYQTAISLDNTRAGRYFSLAQILYELGDFDQALVNLQNAIALDVENLDYGLTMAHWYIEKGLMVDAKNLLEDILVVDPMNAEAKEMMGKVEINNEK